MPVNHSEISSFIWNVCDDVLRGLFKPHEYGDIILPFTVLRRLDCVLEEHKDTVIDTYQEFKDKVEDPSPIILNKETTKIDSTIEKETQRIDLLNEYRQSLISDVVTGKVDVRDEVLV